MVRRSLLPVICAVIGALASSASAQVTSNKVSVAITADVLETLTITVAAPTVAFGAVSPGANNAAPLAQTMSIVTSWNLMANRNVKLYAYFAQSSAALTGTVNGNLVPVSAMTGSVNGGAATAFSAASPFTSGSTALQLYSATVTAGILINTRTDTLALAMNLTSIPNLDNDVYTGTLYLQAQAV